MRQPIADSLSPAASEELVEANQASERVSRVIFEYAARIGQEQDTDSLLRLNADMARDLVDADRCSIWLVDAAAGQLYTKVAHGVPELRIALGHGLVGACVARVAPIVVNDTSSDRRFLNSVDQASGYVTHSVLVLPLRTAEGKVIGAFQALNKPGGFSESDVSLLGLAASYSAGAIEVQRLRKEAEAARLILRELEIARDVQAALLPQHPPAIPEFDCATFFRPAKAVGGDYYDFIETPTGALAFTLGDVSGKGIPAAFLMASIQASLRIPLLRGPDSLPRLVMDVNESIHASSSSGRYSTLFCGLIDPRSRRLAYVNAGQCAPMLVRRRGSGVEVERLTKGGLPVGLLPAADYEVGTKVLQSGDILACFSDGISETCNSQGQLWEEREIEILLRTACGDSANEVIDRLVQKADEFSGGAEQADDMTVLIILVL
jgi:sigma-B regulation protein RsbU (phosphoserine phosphatase)